MKKVLKSLLEWVVIIAVAFALSMVIRNFAIDTRIVPTGSMLPTIQLDDRLIVDRILYKFGTVERGEIIVFKAPANFADDKDLVKRVIGLPGEKLEIIKGKVYINDKLLNEPYVVNQADYDYGPIDIPKDAYFMMGDNRPVSGDSHIWGTLPAENILGKVWIRYWPLDRFGSLVKPPENYFVQ